MKVIKFMLGLIVALTCYFFASFLMHEVWYIELSIMLLVMLGVNIQSLTSE